MLYQKSLRLGVDVRNTRGIGTVVNLQSNDASKVWMMPVHIHTLWNSPFQVNNQKSVLCELLFTALVYTIEGLTTLRSPGQKYSWRLLFEICVRQVSASSVL